MPLSIEEIDEEIPNEGEKMDSLKSFKTIIPSIENLSSSSTELTANNTTTCSEATTGRDIQELPSIAHLSIVQQLRAIGIESQGSTTTPKSVNYMQSVSSHHSTTLSRLNQISSMFGETSEKQDDKKAVDSSH